jgi:NADH-quinone oxidoreductase subunit A
MSEYLGLGLFALLGSAVVVAMLVATTVLGPKLRFSEKVEPFECGERQLVSPYQRFSVKFYLVAVLFILFDIEVVFLYPWAVVFGDLAWFGFIEMGLFILVLAAGLVYAWMKGALDWS